MPLGPLGKYERLDVLGHGASGIVYLARDTLLGRQVALKEIAAQGEEKARFLEEARVLDRLRHPNIVQVNSVDEINGKIVIDMEYIRGRNLQDIVRQTPQLPVAEAVDIAAQIGAGLAYAHSQRTVHRDIKPANILLSRDGSVKLVDFGLAEVLGTHSMAGGAGTYAYMAPEDFHEEEQSDRQSDIWAVGVILYEMLAGRRPFQVAKAKDPFAWRRAVEEDPLTPVTQIRPEVPPALDSIIARALARDKQSRYQDAAELSQDLRALGLAAPASDSPRIGGRGASDSPRKGGDLLDFPPVTDIDEFLSAAPGHWNAARAALIGGSLAQWLDTIGESPLASVAREIAAMPDRDDDDALRDFLYRAGVETTQEARRAHDEGARRFKEGRFDESAALLRRAVHLDPSRPPYHQALARALRAGGDSTGAALALEEALTHHPAQRDLVQEHAETVGAQAVLDSTRVDFGVLRQGQNRTVRVNLRNAGSGVLQGRVVSAPAWVRVEPAAFTTRRRQPLLLTAVSGHAWQTPASYEETVVLETSGGRQEIAVTARVLPARRTMEQIFYWYVPLLVCCLLPTLAGLLAPHLSGHSSARHLWQPGMIASGLLCGAVFVLAVAAETTWLPRLLPLALLALQSVGVGFLINGLSDPGSQVAELALVQTATPVLVLLLLLAAALYRDPNGWGRWQLWRWIVAATGLLVSYALLHMG